MTTVLTAAIEIILKSSLILSCTFVAALVLRRQSAALRHTVLTIGLLCSLALPLFTVVLPVWYVRSAQVLPVATVTDLQTATPESGPIIFQSHTTAPAPARITPERVLLLAWIIGVVSIVSLLLREAVTLARIVFGACTIEETSWRELVWEVSQALQLTRGVRLMRNPNASVLGTWGTIRPRVLLPRESETWPDPRMRVVLAHELAHVKRNDWLIQILAESARAIYWFNPLFWIACKHLRRESEYACDDAAISLGGRFAVDGPTYASHVLDLARMLKHSTQPDAAALAMASTSNLERRLVAMLNPSLNRRVTGKWAAAVIVLLALGLTLPLAAVSSQAPVQAVPLVRAPEFVLPTVAIPVPAAPVRVARAGQAQPAPVVVPVSRVAEAPPTPPLQVVTATLSGTVSDPSGALIPGVSVSLTAQSTGVVRRTLTHESGDFTFADLPQDTYSGTADLPGFQRAVFSYLVAEAGTARLRIPLAIAPLQTTVDIAAMAPSGLKCFSVFGAFKADGTPFTEADCLGGAAVLATTPNSPAQAVTGVTSPIAITKVDSPIEGPSTSADGRRIPIRVGGSLQAGSLLVHPSPGYPSEARSRGVLGPVIAAGVITKDGQLQALRIVTSANPLLETSVLETLQGWKYKPTLLNGEPVEVMTVITLNFTLVR